MTQRFKRPNFRLPRRVICFSSSFSLLMLLELSGVNQYASTAFSTPLSPAIQSEVSGGRVYTPPKESRISGEDHTGGGVRGCGEDLAALAPRLTSMGQTLSRRPTFVWYVFGDHGDPLEFHLYRYQSDGGWEEVLIRPIGASQPGYMSYTLPLEEPELQVGETYLWQVALYCDHNLQEVGRWTSADIAIVEPPATLAAGRPEEPVQQARAYARAGLWYDALASVYDAKTPEEQSFRHNLLLDLAELEERSGQASAVKLSAELRQIAPIW